MNDELIKALRIYANDETDELRFEAADAIEELQAAEKKYLAIISALETENQHLKRERDWIPVTERLPSGEAERYLVAYPLMSLGLRVAICYYADNLEEVDEYDFKDEKHSGFYWYDDEYGYCEQSDVKYWMPLPEPSKEES